MISFDEVFYRITVRCSMALVTLERSLKRGSTYLRLNQMYLPFCAFRACATYFLKASTVRDESV